LPECINSILSQTYGDFEILIMDDCSPDNTREVAQSFTDPRVQYIRNDPNLGHLRNYNKGIGIARGKYIWLISGDDRLRVNYALERYVRLMETHPSVGYVFCPAMSLEDAVETRAAAWTVNGIHDTIIDGRRFAARLVESNSVAAPSAMARRACYDKMGVFPLDLPYAGDWYLWCLFALHFDVAYFTEPMVNYRLHGMSMTSHTALRRKLEDNLAVRWRIKRLAQDARLKLIAKRCLDSLAAHYAYCVKSAHFGIEEYCLTSEEFEESLKRNADNFNEISRIQSRVHVVLGDTFCHHGQPDKALQQYRLALQENLWMPRTWAKYILTRMGSGELLRRRPSRAS
jgi:glycosyltransferase involved in cell wall biosynthesis